MLFPVADAKNNNVIDEALVATQTSNSGEDSDNSFGSFKDDIIVTVLPSVHRLLRDDISAPGKAKADLFCAKNETESFQIIVTNKSYDLLPDIEIHVSNWQGPESSKKPIITLFREHYVRIDKPTGLSRIERLSKVKKGETGIYPDALVPFVDPYTGNKITGGIYRTDHQFVGPEKNQGYWADVRVEADVPAGAYTCSILVTSSSRPVAEIPLVLTVWDFELPKTRELTVWLPRIKNLGGIYGVRGNSAKYDQLMTRHMDMLYEHGIYPNFDKKPSFDSTTGGVTFTSPYISELRTFVNKYGPRLIRISANHFSNEWVNGQNPKFARLVNDFHRFSVAHPEFGQFFMLIDEPYEDEDGTHVINVGRVLDKYAPSIKLIINGAWFKGYEDPEVTESAVEAACDIRCLYSDYVNKEEEITKVQDWLNQEKKIWICPGTPKWCIDRNILNFRMPIWRSYILGGTGIFAWRSSVSDPELDPWVNPVTYIYNDGRVANGGGLLIYQGTPTRVGFSGAGGPVASMRLKVLRDSVEDYAYFKLLESLAGRTDTVKLVSPIAPDFRTCKSPTEYENTRKKIAALILQQLEEN